MNGVWKIDLLLWIDRLEGGGEGSGMKRSREEQGRVGG
jgi:hypothetical protein